WQGPSGAMSPDYTYRCPPRAFSVGPHAAEASEFIEITGTQALVDYGLRPVGAGPLLIVLGRADYQDVFGQVHFTKWCYQLRYDSHKGEGLRATFIQYGEYNSSD